MSDVVSDDFGKVTKPTLYKPEMLEWVEKWTREGICINEICKGLGIAKSTYYNWIETIPEFADAIERGEKYKINQVVNALYKRAVGYEYEEVTKENGVIKKRVKKHIPGDTTAQQVYLYNRDPENWQARRSESTQNINVNLQLEDWEAKRKQILDEIKRLELQSAVDVEAIPAEDDSAKI